MRAQDHHTKIDILFCENKIIKDKVKKDIKSKIATSTHGIPIEFQRHKWPKQKIKRIDQTGYALFHLYFLTRS